MKRFLSCAAAALAALTLAILLAGGTGEKSKALRLHVIANSDSDEDQRIKLLVRDAVLECMGGCEGAATPKEARELLLSKGELLQEAADRVLLEEGADYGASLISGRFDFPEKTYAGNTYPAGEYEALRIVLGEGEGQNWWCVMFPPLCLIDSGGGVEKNADGTLRFRSFFCDLWRGIFG